VLVAFEALQPLPDAFHRLERAFTSTRRIVAVADQPPPVTDALAHRAAVMGPLTLEEAWLRYQPGGRWALAGVDLRVEPGRRVALVGASGSGKTSVANVLLRFHELDRGRATLGGFDLREYRQDDVRGLIGLCAQDAHVFATSLYENVRLARPDGAYRAMLDLLEPDPAGLVRVGS
jgi:ABC-type transport system involved in cytochrome bd biosynthesis fused ATPase/permease subunit